MRFVSAYVILAALVSAAPLKRRDFTKTLGVAPYEPGANLAQLDASVSPIDLDFSVYSSFGIPEDTDQFKCHGTCGVLIRISRTKEHCKHPYAQPFADYCMGPCQTLSPPVGYPTATKFANECNLGPSRPAKDTEDTHRDKKTADAPKEEKKADTQPQPDSSKEEKVDTQHQLDSSEQKKVDDAQAPSGNSITPTSTGAISVATQTPTPTTVEVNGASSYFDFATAVVVAALAMLAVY